MKDVILSSKNINFTENNFQILYKRQLYIIISINRAIVQNHYCNILLFNYNFYFKGKRRV